MKWFTNMRIASKLIISFVLVAVIAGAIGLVGIININQINRTSTEMYEKMTVPISEMATIATSFQKIRVDTRDIVLADDVAEISKFEESIKKNRADIDKSATIFEKTIIAKEVRDAYNGFLAARQAYSPYLDNLTQMARENKDDEANALLHSAGMKKAVADEQAAIELLVDLKLTSASNSSSENSEMARTVTVTMIAFVVGGMLLAIILGIIISRMISRPVSKLARSAEMIADGDLSAEIDIDSKDEVGLLAASFKRMTVNLNEVMGNISTAADQVASGAKQVSDSSMALSQGATEQASSIEQLTASIEEISSQTRLNAENATQANSLAESARSNAALGNDQMKQMLKAMDEINDSSGKISKIIKVIDEIAFQTNILALNAAVEAARAGQHGKGFAVVAEEVRNLAARSANAAKETTDMIESSIKKAEGGTKIANDTAGALNSIVEGVARVAALVGQIAVASNEQATGIAQVNQGVMQVSQVVQTNSATSEESAAASEELSSQAQTLREQVARFKLKKVAYSASRQAYDEVSPEVLRMLEQISGSRRAAPAASKPFAAETRAPAKKIALSDLEFGKY